MRQVVGSPPPADLPVPIFTRAMSERARSQQKAVMVQRRRGLLRTALLAAAIVVAGWLVVNGFPSLNPFAEKTVDRSPPPVLRSITELSEYHAATANLQQVVDIERDAKYLPSFIKGSRTLLVATGSVDAVVDFSGLDRRAVQLSKDGKTATVTVPAPRLDRPRVDLKNSRVVSRDRGLVDRVGSVFKDGTTSDRALLIKAQDRLAGAAASDPELLRTARRNTTSMLTGLLRELGVQRVTVRFSPAPPV
jgi:hypothetical protein